MREMNYFQATALAIRRTSAIRRITEQKWFYYRSGWWWCWEGGVALPVRNTDWTDAQFMAKDFTDEPWEDGSFPPCCNPEPKNEGGNFVLVLCKEL